MTARPEAGVLLLLTILQVIQKPLYSKVNAIKLLFVKLSQEVYNKMPMLPSEEIMLLTIRIL